MKGGAKEHTPPPNNMWEQHVGTIKYVLDGSCVLCLGGIRRAHTHIHTPLETWLNNSNSCCKWSELGTYSGRGLWVIASQICSTRIRYVLHRAETTHYCTSLQLSTFKCTCKHMCGSCFIVNVTNRKNYNLHQRRINQCLKCHSMTAIVEIGAKQDLQQRIMVDIISLRRPVTLLQVLYPNLSSLYSHTHHHHTYA